MAMCLFLSLNDLKLKIDVTKISLFSLKNICSELTIGVNIRSTRAFDLARQVWLPVGNREFVVDFLKRFCLLVDILSVKIK